MAKKNLLIEKDSGVVFKNVTNIFKSKNTIPISSPIVIAGPCSVENECMLEIIAKKMSESGVSFLRGGIFKPRTSPYDFQGIGVDGLKMLKSVSDKYNLYTVSEVTDIRYIEAMVEYVDVLQIGSRNMHNFELLKEIGKTTHPVLLKRGMCATINEFKMAAEYIALGGNRNIILLDMLLIFFSLNQRHKKM